MRLACLFVPDFPLQALRRTRPELAEAPLAIVAGPSPRDVVVAVAGEAAGLGVQVGMTAAQARQCAPQAMVRMVPAATTASAGEALRDVATAFSPRVGHRQAGEVLLDVGGLLPRFGSEVHLAHELLRAAHRVGLEARVGIAGSVGVARIAARLAHASLGSSRSPSSGRRAPVHGRSSASPPAGSIEYATPYLWRQEPGAGVAGALTKERRCRVDIADACEPGGPGMCVVRPGGEGAFVAPLPVTLLEPSPLAAARLAAWGIRRAGELAALPRQDVALRLGEAGAPLHRLACGEADEEFIPDPVPETLAERVELEFPVGDLETFLFVLRGMLSRLAERLALRGEGFGELLLELRLEGGERVETRTTMVAPSREVGAVLPLVRLQLEARPPGAPVEGITAVVTPGEVRLVQGSLFGPRTPTPAKLAQALARLAALVGPERVGAAALPDTHRPGAWSLVPFAPGRDEGAPDRRRSAAGPAPAPPVPSRTAPAPVLRAFRPPREARVVTAGTRPAVVQVGRLGGTVMGWAGPYRFVGEWWGEEPLARDEFDVATADGAVLRIYFDRLQRRWFADGVYD